MADSESKPRPSGRRPESTTHAKTKPANEQQDTVVPGKGEELEATVIGEQGGSVQPSDPHDTQPARPQSPASESGAKRVTQLGEFRLVKRLGKGGMGEVFLAHQTSLDRKVALKVLAKQFADKPDFVQRFYREARSQAKLVHPNIVSCYAVGEDHGVHYVAMEFIDGRSMQDWMNDLGQLTIGDALRVTLVCAEALKHAHDTGLVHRDIKPDNILVTKKGIAKLADLGLAKAMDDDMSMTQSGTGMGTPHYMPPEQARNAKHADHRSDIYALGCTLYYFLTGKLPFSADSTMELILAKEQGTYTAARRLNSQVPERLDLIIDKAMAKDPKHRYASCDDLIRDLSSLGLESSSLSFISAEAKSAPPVQAGRSRKRNKLAETKPASMMTTSADDAAKTAVMKSGSVQRKWYVRHTNDSGKLSVSRMSTEQIQQAIRSEVLDLKAKAKQDKSGEFLPLAQHAEFENLMKKRLVKAKSERRGADLRDAYAKIDKAHRRRLRWRWLKRLTENTLGGFGLILYLAVIAAVIYGLYLGIPILYDKIAAQFHLK